jgi:hypothetical protein
MVRTILFCCIYFGVFHISVVYGWSYSQVFMAGYVCGLVNYGINEYVVQKQA